MSSVQTQQPQQPAQIYPTNNIVANQQPHESNGSFGTVFIVLAVILVISVLACVLGRLCNKRFSNRHHSHSHDPRHHHVKPNRQQIHNVHPREVVEGEEDIEYGGVDKRIPPPIIAERLNPNNNNGHHVSHGGVEGTAGPHRHHPPPMMKGFEIKHGPHQQHLREVA
ncbi:hypothetical protein PIB30_007976 [Stylosanthes scabra]|uniref:Transmembrane protein n=1 Tax=Stylosanthes scabra TaxID=79078 RepID=A0ABU6T6V4_9FABA|nr:hypothetical protein [Stylosanthes scabra]